MRRTGFNSVEKEVCMDTLVRSMTPRPRLEKRMSKRLETGLEDEMLMPNSEGEPGKWKKSF